MSKKNQRFGPRSNNDFRRLVDEQPVAWIVSGNGKDFRASLLPVRPYRTEGNCITELVGHFPRSNDQVDLLREDPEARVLFLGPNAYISPSWMKDRSWAPTWNFASAQCRVRIKFFEDENRLRAHLEELVNCMEEGRENQWRLEDIGDRYATLARHIIGFTAQIEYREERYKLAQDENDEVFTKIVEGLAKGEHQALLEWVKRFNPDRPKTG
ncbi:transcriptional regulator [Natronospira proteinivora]|uniref:Transcriptional regulator n=1 Tax=Natronospira proteinivora TaxID=1807133 RepID=A0ABT1G8E8_9GAMM|nr:FMN-binding negative transcriptional regulator [Natronospira proteinivora]MCP1727589.1 transcriptional regulator [Natronospira proteinivora]